MKTNGRCTPLAVFELVINKYFLCVISLDSPLSIKFNMLIVPVLINLDKIINNVLFVFSSSFHLDA